VRGTGANNLLDFCPNALRILNDLVRPEANDTPTFTFQCRCSARIGLDLKSVMIAVDLDHEFPRQAGEVGKIAADRVLSAKFRPADAAISQKFPDLALGAAAVATEVACLVGIVVFSGHNPLT
jgi:hypothetical protein